jgi:hypothetical protein
MTAVRPALTVLNFSLLASLMLEGQKPTAMRFRIAANAPIVPERLAITRGERIKVDAPVGAIRIKCAWVLPAHYPTVRLVIAGQFLANVAKVVVVSHGITLSRFTYVL